MNIKSFFNGTVLKKDLTRFLPLWVIYLILGLLLAVSNMGQHYCEDARQLGESLQWLSVVLCLYALIAAQLLFGELFQGRMCNAVHALPVRREGLFLSHFVAGMIMGIGPNVIIALVSMLTMGRLWFVALLWLAGAAMMYLLFFGMAVFCMLCSGNRFGGIALYALVNFLGVIVMWFYGSFYLPMLYGMELTSRTKDIFYVFSPVVKLAEENDWFHFGHYLYSPSGSCHLHVYASSLPRNCDCVYVYYLKGLGSIWIYLGIMAAVGLIFAAAALLLYRKRHLESAGDFLSVKPVGMLFTLVASACMGGLCYYIAAETFIGMAVGLVVGFFICRMLLERTIKVFGKKNWLQLVAFCLVVALSFGLTAFDVFGVASHIPDTKNVKSVTIADTYLSEYRLDDLNLEQPRQETTLVPVMADPYYAYSKEGMMTLTKADDIETIRQIHQLLIDEGDAFENGTQNHLTVTLHYVLKNGSTITRYYRTARNSPAMEKMAQYTGSPQFILGYSTPEEMVKYLRSAYLYYYYDKEITDPEQLEDLVYALLEDTKAGRFVQNEHDMIVGEMNLEFQLENGLHTGTYLMIPKTASSTIKWLDQFSKAPDKEPEIS